MNENNLTDRQRRNLAAVRIRRELTKRKYGDMVQVVTTDEEAAANTGAAAMPIGSLGNHKPLTMRWNMQHKGGAEERMEDSKVYDDLTEALIDTEKRLLGQKVDKNAEPVSDVITDAADMQEVSEIGKVTTGGKKKFSAKDAAKLRELLK